MPIVRIYTLYHHHILLSLMTKLYILDGRTCIQSPKSPPVMVAELQQFFCWRQLIWTRKMRWVWPFFSVDVAVDLAVDVIAGFKSQCMPCLQRTKTTPPTQQSTIWLNYSIILPWRGRSMDQEPLTRPGSPPYQRNRRGSSPCRHCCRHRTYCNQQATSHKMQLIILTKDEHRLQFH